MPRKPPRRAYHAARMGVRGANRRFALAVAGAIIVATTACSPATTNNDSRTTTTPSTPAPTETPAAPATPQPPTTTSLVLAVHPTTPPLNLTSSQAQAILAGTVTDWGALGLPPGPLRFIAGPQVPNATPAATLSSDQEAVAAVARDPTVIAAIPGGTANASVRALPVDGQHPLRNPGTYPLSMPGPTPPAKATTVAAVGDLMLARRVGQVMQRSGDFAAPLRNTAERLAAADITTGNFEGTLARLGPPQQGNDSFGADPRVREGLQLAGFDVVTLANNHLGDYGPQSLLETVRLLREANFQTTGAGATLAEASTSVVVERDGVRFGFLAFDAIGETPAAGPNAPGAFRLRMQPRTGPLVAEDLEALLTAVRTLATQVDVVLVAAHWGTQYTTQLVPDQQVVAKALLDAGADVILGGHPHWVQGAETRGEALIAYSLGNFIFDMTFMQQTQEGVILELTFWGPRLVAAEFVPIRIGPDFAARVVDFADGLPILEQLWSSSAPPYGLRR
jgi:poly-gamma-glutamate capsule biosynthesis protein CapA/YwtB (metallophosphatase superfamily)